MKTVLLKKIFLLSFMTAALSLTNAYSQDLTPEQEFVALTMNRMEILKPQSRPFIISQGKKAPTAVLIHGLSDSPGSMVEVAKIYKGRGYNVLTVLLRDHGLSDPELRHDLRENIKLSNLREDIDKVMSIAYKMSDSEKVALAGYSLGGALATDTADRYSGKISSLALMAPLFKMKQAWAAPLSKYAKHIKYSLFKGIPEAPHFYPDIALNQSEQAYKLTKHLKNNVTKNASAELKALPKILFLTDADTTIKNSFALKTAHNIAIPESHIVMYETIDDETVVLHRDLPMRNININNKENPHIDNMLNRLDVFLSELE